MATTIIDASTVHSATGCDATVERSPRSVVVNNSAAGMLWFAGWLFTIGYAGLGFWRALLGLIIWPYFLGALAR